MSVVIIIKKLIIFLMALILMSSAASATSNSLSTPVGVVVVSGNVYLNDGSETPVVGADVYAVCVDIPSYISDTVVTNGDGNYMVPLECTMDSDVRVYVTVGGETWNNESYIVYIGTLPVVGVDVGVSKINVGIPEFPIAAIPAILSMLSFGLIRKRLI